MEPQNETSMATLKASEIEVIWTQNAKHSAEKTTELSVSKNIFFHVNAEFGL